MTTSQAQPLCAMCARPLAPADVLYTAQALAVCATCFEKADVAAAKERGGPGVLGSQGGFTLSVGVGGGNLKLPVGERGLLIAGGICGLLPFVLPPPTVHSVVGAPVIGGAIAVGLGVVGLISALLRGPKPVMRVFAIAVILLGAVQLVHGFGVF